METLWIIESRNSDGTLELGGLQPEEVFGTKAITGMTDWEMSRVIYQFDTEAVLTGENIAMWPAVIHPMWRARQKTWR